MGYGWPKSLASGSFRSDGSLNGRIGYAGRELPLCVTAGYRAVASSANCHPIIEQHSLRRQHIPILGRTLCWPDVNRLGQT